MTSANKDILARLHKDMLHLQGYKTLGAAANTIYEFISEETGHAAATSGFVNGLLSRLMKAGKSLHLD